MKMNRRFRIRTNQKTNGSAEVWIGDSFCDLEDQISEDSTLEQFTGLTDINGQEIYEGDTVVVYPTNYQKVLVENDGATAPVYFADTDKPLPLKDIVLYKGKVVWSAPEFRIEVEENENGVSSIPFHGYWTEVIGVNP